MRTIFRILACGLFVAAAHSAAPLGAQVTNSLDYVQRRASAVAAFQAGQYAPASEHARAALAFADWDGELWLLLARAARLAGDEALALSAYTEAIARGIGGGFRDYDLRLAVATLLATSTPDSAFRVANAALAARAPRTRITGDSILRSLSSSREFSSLRGPVPPADTDRAAGWRSDIEFLVAEARRLHATSPSVAHSPDFAREAAALAARVPSVSDAAVAIGIQRLLAMLGDGHTVLYPIPTSRIRFGSVPVDLYRFPEGVFVVAGEGEAAGLVGARVISVGGVAVDEALRRIEPYVSRDNDMGIEYVGPYFLAMPMMLHEIGAAPNAAAATYELELPGGVRRTLTFSTGGHRRLPKLRAAAAQAPLWLQRSDVPFWVQRLPGGHTVYAQINQITNTESESMRRFAIRVRDTVLAADARTLVLDLRHNGGGNNFLNPALVELAAWFEFSRDDRRVIALTSRVTFSAAQNLVNVLDRFTGTVFAGEPSGSKPNFTGEDNAVLLPWSGLTVSIANRRWADSYPEDGRQWVAPDIPYRLNAADFFAGRDPLLDAVLHYASQREGR